MRLKHDYGKGGKQVDLTTSDDHTPQWEDRLKNQMGFATTSNCARARPGNDKIRDRGVKEQKRLLDNLGVKPYTENDQAEVVQDRLEPEKNEPKGS